MNIVAHIIHKTGVTIAALFVIALIPATIYTLYIAATKDTQSAIWGAGGAFVIVGLLALFGWAKDRVAGKNW